MNEIKNAAPQLILWGIDDQSGRLAPAVSEAVPIHLPFLPTYARKGKLNPQFVAGRALQVAYGAETLDFRGPYATHATPFIDGFNRYANIMMLQRLETEGSATSTLQFGIELLPAQVPEYERMPDGSYKYDDSNALIPTGTMIDGYIGKWVAKALADGVEVGTSTQGVGSLVDGDTQSIYYPVIDFKWSSFGAWGNDTGVRLFSQYNTGLQPVDEELVNEIGSQLFGFQLMTRVNAQSTPTVSQTLTGAQSTQFSFKPGAFNKSTDIDLHWDERILPGYSDIDEDIDGPFEAAYLYQDNLDAVLGMILAKEHVASPGTFPTGTDEDLYLVNPLSAKFIDGVPYRALVLHGIVDGGVEFTPQSTYYGLGGDDGQMGNEAYNKAVATLLTNFGESEHYYEDMARYPFSAFYDTGFDMDTKKLIPRILGVRKDVHICLATQDVMKRPNTVEEDSSIGVALRTATMAMPESLLHGTSACRGVIVLHSGYAADSNYKQMLPGNYELAMKRARYMGAGDGFMKPEFAYDQEETRVITYMKRVTNLSKPQKVRNKDWDRGLTYYQWYDTKRGFHPMTRSVYNNDTSILTSEVVMQIATNCNRVAFWVWRELVGNGKLTAAQFIQKSDQKIAKYTKGRYDGRCVIRPETYETPADVQRGYSVSGRIHLYAPNTKTVSAVSIVTHRMEDLQAAA